MKFYRPSVLFLTKYSRNGASSRYRTYQYLPLLEQAGFDAHVMPLLNEAYLEQRYHSGARSLRDILSAFCGRMVSLCKVRRFDIVVIEYELLPYSPAFLERILHWSGVPYLVDYDDALFHQYDSHQNGLVRMLLGNKIANVIRNSELVIAGNQYLADYAESSGAKRIEILPTVVELDHYPMKVAVDTDHDVFTVGWIGSPSTSKYLTLAAPVLTELCKETNGCVRLIGSGNVIFPDVRVEILPWSEETEVALLQTCDVGIMPLPDEPWTRGKCGFKMIQYMACGLPVVASPVGVNKEIVEHGVNGFLAVTNDEWLTALSTLRDNPELRRKMGAAGRRKVEEKYCLQVTAPQYVKLLQSMIEKH
jgi:glycosyltransferase involved in cell wall biosynthesis